MTWGQLRFRLQTELLGQTIAERRSFKRTS
jgi:hypothetical protein